MYICVIVILILIIWLCHRKGYMRNIRSLGTFTTESDCKAACAKNAWCKNYIWNGTNTNADNKCYGMHHAAEKFSLHGLGYNVGTFSNTLQRRMGMGSAAAPSEHLTSGDVGYGTMYQDYQHRAVLPG